MQCWLLRVLHTALYTTLSCKAVCDGTRIILHSVHEILH